MCWLGFVITAISHFQLGDFSSGIVVSLPEFNWSFWQSNDGLIWGLWTAGSGLIVASWIGIVGNRAGWLGLCAAMTCVVASWREDKSAQLGIIVGGTAVVITLLLVSLKRGALLSEE